MMATQPQTTISHSKRRAVSIWLALCLFIIAMMVVIGGLTRLTESGLSIVEWKPIAGVLPPLNDTEWESVFNDYKTTPQFKKSFPDMALEQFKHIYWLEYIHRLLGRVAGVIFLLPLVCFIALGSLPASRAFKLALIFALGGAQGTIGWYMVQSGLLNDPHVSPYRLALHLSTGFMIFGLILWQMLSFTHPSTPGYSVVGEFVLPKPPRYLKIVGCFVMVLIFMQVVLGAFVAGLHAGLIYNTFPLMDGQWIPDGILPTAVWYKDLFEDVTTVQFAHRTMAYLLSIAIPAFWLLGRTNPHIAHLLPILFSIFVVQFLFGVLTLLFAVPIPLASLHQANALLLFAITVTILHRLFIPLETRAYDTGSKASSLA